jgi:hypothetical protein
MRKAFDWKRSRISYVGSRSRTPELYSVIPDWFKYCFIYEKCVACRGFDLRPSNQYILASSWGSCSLFIWIWDTFLVDRLGSVSFQSPFLIEFWIASRLDCSFCETMAGTLSVATTAVFSPKVVVADSGEVGRSAVYSRYNNGPWTLPCGTPALTEDSCVYSVSAFSSCLFALNGLNNRQT